MNTISLFIGWLFGILFLVVGIDAFSESAIGGISFILISFLLLPLTRSLAFTLLKKEIPSWGRGLAIFLLMITFGFFMTQSKNIKSLEMQVQLAEAKTTQTFSQQTKNSSKRLKNVKRNLRKGEYKQVASVSKKHLPSKKKEPIKLHNKVNTNLTKYQEREGKTSEKPSIPGVESSETSINEKILAKAQKENNKSKSKEILAKLKDVPVSQYERNMDLYQQLVDLNPSKQKYKRKLKFYENKVEKSKNTETAQTDEKNSANREHDNASKSKSILAKLKDIPASEYESNRDLYQQLVALNPNKKKYKKKLEYYSRKYENKIEKPKNTKSAQTDEKNDANGELDNASKSKAILAKLKEIPASQYENNRDLYQQLVTLNPNKKKYKNKLEYYSRKIAENTNLKLTDSSNEHLSCEDILSKKKFISTPEWLSTNGHCLTKKQKKKMEIHLLANVRKLSTKKAKKNRDGYKALSILNPGNNSYLKKLKRYEKKLRISSNSRY